MIRRLGLVPALAAAVLAVVACPPAARAAGLTALKTVRYHGLVLRVPASWPVYRLSAGGRQCVRFDRHAVYLGVPAATQGCPPHLVGRTEAILVSPLAVAHSADVGSAQAPALPGVHRGPVFDALLNVPRLGVRITLTWATAPRVVQRALSDNPALRGRLALPARASGSAAVHAPNAHASGRRAGSPTSTPFTGFGFDACSAPSQAQMADWTGSPYRAIGIYIGGANMACSQSNLSSAWTSNAVAGGWHLVPTYVGLQAPDNSCGCAAIKTGQAAAEGQAAAQDAMTQAALLGIGAGNPIYDDMEAYPTGGQDTHMVLNFLAAWTQTLHAGGYLSGVYSSSNSGIHDLASMVGTSYTEPDDVWVAAWNGLQSTSDANLSSAEWPSHQRLHQYEGGHNETYNSSTLSIDSDYLDGATAGAAAPFPDGSFVQLAGTTEVFRIAGGAPLYVSDPTTVGGATPTTTISQAQYDALGAVPLDGTFLTTAAGAIYRVAGGAALPVSSWTLYGGQQSSVTIDPWDIANAGNPLSHLNAVPLSGTVVQGLPSGHYWRFVGSQIQPTTGTPAAIQVDDQALTAYPQLAPPPPPPPPACVVPALHKLKYRQAITALNKAHCRLGKVRWPKKRHHRPVFRVKSQNPKAHTHKANGFRVNITVYYA